LALPWHDAALISLHGREPDKAELAYRAGRIIGMLTDRKYTSQTVAKLLMSLGWPEAAEMFVCARLSYIDERIRHTTLARAAAEEEIVDCILVVKA
jgi:cobalt-precorrin-7 (C5)-methyltransferase